MNPSKRRSGQVRMWRVYRRHAKRVALFAAAWPLCQAVGCFPDLLGAVNFELQSLIVSTFVGAFDIVVRNLLRL